MFKLLHNENQYLSELKGMYNEKKLDSDLENIEEVALEAGKRAVEKLGAKSVQTAQVPVVFDRYASGSFWRGIISAFNGDSVYKKTTFLSDYLNKPVASKLIIITDNPTMPRHMGSLPFDGEGKITKDFDF